MSNLLSRTIAPARLATTLLALTAGLHVARSLLSWLMVGFMAALQLGPRMALPPREQAIGSIFELAIALSTVAGITSYLVWLHRVTDGLRSLGERTRFSPAMAVGGWFIPLANFALPMLSLGDVMRRIFKGELDWVAPAWWSCFVSSQLLRAVWGIPGLQMYVYRVPVVPWLTLFTTVAAYSMLAFAISRASAQTHGATRDERQTSTASI